MEQRKDEVRKNFIPVDIKLLLLYWYTKHPKRSYSTGHPVQVNGKVLKEIPDFK